MAEQINPVTLVTKDATLDDLSASDYRDIYEELRERDPQTGAYAVSLDKFVTLVTSQYSKAQWSKYHNGETQLTRTMRNELRRIVGLPLLPPTVADAVTAVTSPDAAVWRIGAMPAEHVIMVTTSEPLTLHVNGSVTIAAEHTEHAENALVTAVTTPVRVRRHVYRPIASDAQNQRRLTIGVTWQEIINAGLLYFENAKDCTHEHP